MTSYKFLICFNSYYEKLLCILCFDLLMVKCHPNMECTFFCKI
jgi:hypothetical protein